MTLKHKMLEPFSSKLKKDFQIYFRNFMWHISKSEKIFSQNKLIIYHQPNNTKIGLILFLIQFYV